MTKTTQTLILSALTIPTFALTAVAASAERPNILFIFADDHCTQAISAYGSNRIQTPGLDRIAKEGKMFWKCYVTNGICGPSRATIQTGKYSHKNGFLSNGNQFDGSQQTFPKLLQAGGYQTAVIGKWHLGTTPQGFDYFDVLKGQGPYYNPPMLTDVGAAPSEAINVSHTGYTTHIITNKALTWLKEERDEEKPFMLMYQHKAPHRNWQPGPKYLTMYDDVEIPQPETLFDDYEGRTQGAAKQTMSIEFSLSATDLKLKAPNNLTPEQRATWDAAYDPKNAEFEKANLKGKELIKWKYQRYVKDYLRCVKAVDDDIVKVLDYLDEAGLAENTVVIYSSDQGWYLGEHGWFDKRWMYEESLVTPLIVRWPGVIEPGSHDRDHITSNLDFAQTFLDLAGAEQPADMQGASLVPLFRGESPKDWRTTFYYHYYEGLGRAHNVPAHYGVTDGKHKLIHMYQYGADWELFDLERDPNELKSEYDNPEYSAKRKQLEAEITRLRALYEVPDKDPVGTKKPKSPKKLKGKKPAEEKKEAA